MEVSAIKDDQPLICMEKISTAILKNISLHVEKGGIINVDGLKTVGLVKGRCTAH